MRRILYLAALLVALLSAPVYAQLSKTLSSTTCPGTGCMVVTANGSGTVGVQVTGTFSATFVFEQTIDGSTWIAWPVTPSNSSVTVTSATATGVWTGSTVGINQTRVRVSVFTSGSLVVSATTSIARNNATGGTSSVLDSDVTFSDITTGNATSAQHGFLPKLSGTTSTFLRGDGAYASATVADSAVSFTDITTGNGSSSAHGFLPKLSGNAYDSFLGSGSFGHTFARGTIVASDPWVYSQTWNNNAVTFRGLDLSIVGIPVTNYGQNSTFFRVLGGAAGTTCYFGVQPNHNGGCFLSINGDGATYSTGGFISQGAGMQANTTRFPYQSSRQYIDTVTVNTFQIAAQSGGVSYTFMTGAAPALTSGWGTGATVVGNSSVGRITIGTTPGATGTLTFVEAFITNAPHCNFNNETSGLAPTKVATTTTTAAVTATFVASDKVTYNCIGFQ